MFCYILVMDNDILKTIDWENDLVVYMRCCDRLEHLSHVMSVYPKEWTLEDVEKDLRRQAKKFHDLVKGGSQTK